MNTVPRKVWVEGGLLAEQPIIIEPTLPSMPYCLPDDQHGIGGLVPCNWVRRLDCKESEEATNPGWQ